MRTLIRLTKPNPENASYLTKLLLRRFSNRRYKKTAAITADDFSNLLFAAQGINHRREQTRTAPSAGALFPLEIYAAVARVDGVAPGIYRYRAKDHSVQLVVEGDFLTELADAAWQQDWIANAAVLLVYCAIPQRTTKKYGSRGHQYIFIETGHAAQNVFLYAIERHLASAVIGAFDGRRVKKICHIAKREVVIYFQTVGVPSR